MSEAPGSTLGPFRIVAPIGSGGFATVYRARDERLDSDVAIKVLAENHSLDPDIRERFLREARLLRAVASEHVVKLLDIGETERRQPYLVLEYAAGGDLRRRVEQLWESGGRVTDDDLRLVAAALADALEGLHAHDIVHRDVSPGNLLVVPGPHAGQPLDGRLLAEGERLVLADLGLAKDLGQHSGITVGGGTQGFSPPHQRGAAATSDPRDDVYAASAVLAWLHTGESPDRFSAGSPAKDLRRAGVPASFAEVLGRGMAGAPKGRQRDISTWRAEVLAALAPPAPEISAVEAAGAGGAEVPRRRRLPLTAAFVAGAVLAAVGTFILVGTDDGDGARRSQLGEGQVRVQREVGDVRAAVFGPSSVAVGETAVFEAAVIDAVDFGWVTPEGRLVGAEPRVEVTALDPGRARIQLLVTTADGEAFTIEHRFDVTEP